MFNYHVYGIYNKCIHSQNQEYHIIEEDVYIIDHNHSHSIYTPHFNFEFTINGFYLCNNQNVNVHKDIKIILNEINKGYNLIKNTFQDPYKDPNTYGGMSSPIIYGYIVNNKRRNANPILYRKNQNF